MQHEPGITAEDSLLSVTSLSFDIAGLELFLPLMVGAQVTIAPSDVAADGFRLAALMKECDATIMQATPATWRLLLEAGWEGSQSLKILCGGEAWPSELAGELLPRCASLWNMYGPTETTVWSSVARIEGDQRVLIGPPIANTTFYVLDLYGQPVPVGVPGELHIGGDGVARGYLNRPELTRERFVADPFSNETAARMYKTGDRVRHLPDGRLEFLGRLDHQVKIRGYRIELGEIEAVLQTSSRGTRCGSRGAGRWGRRKTACRLRDRKWSRVQYRSAACADLLRRKLAPYMIPAALVPLDAFPLTPNGKIDRNALPLPDDQMRRDTGAAYVAPRTPLEELLASFWCDHLGVKQVGIHDNFFDLGGDSLAMIRLSLEIERATGSELPAALDFRCAHRGGNGRDSGWPEVGVQLFPPRAVAPWHQGAAGFHGPSRGRQHYAIDTYREIASRRSPDLRDTGAKASTGRTHRMIELKRWRTITSAPSPRRSLAGLTSSLACVSAAWLRWKLPVACQSVENQLVCWPSLIPTPTPAIGHCASG